MGFDIVSITSLDDGVPLQDLQPLVSVKRLITQQRRKYKVPPPTTRCLIQFAPPPQGTAHIRSIQSGSSALDTLLSTEPQPPPALPRSATYTARITPIKRSSSAQAPTRINIRAERPSSPPLRETLPSRAPPHRPQPAPLDEHTLTSISFWRRETRIGTPYLGRDHTPL